MKPLLPDQGMRLSRRRFVTGLATAGAALACGRVLAAPAGAVSIPELAGARFDLRIGYQRVNFTGVERLATTINGSLPGPTLHWREGDQLRLRVTNQLAEDTSLHWHGIVLPAAMDGVPGMSFHGIKPGEIFDYAFAVRQSGTYWYHSHSGFQEQTGNYGALVIHPREPDPFACACDYVVMLSDWTDEDPAKVHAKLKKLSHYYNFGERTAGDLWRDIQARGVAQTWRDRAMWNRMRMSDSDISDVSGYTYTYLMNGQPPATGWTGLFRPGERVRLRFINAAAMTYFDVRIPGLKMRVIAADGQPVEPVTVDDFRIGVAETYDVIVEPA
ncbi:MAG: copper resistance system multicopper oxidase, partial [Porticoccaceae bacterium]